MKHDPSSLERAVLVEEEKEEQIVNQIVPRRESAKDEADDCAKTIADLVGRLQPQYEEHENGEILDTGDVQVMKTVGEMKRTEGKDEATNPRCPRAPGQVIGKIVRAHAGQGERCQHHGVVQANQDGKTGRKREDRAEEPNQCEIRIREGVVTQRDTFGKEELTRKEPVA